MQTIIEAFKSVAAVVMGMLAAAAVGLFGLLIYDKNRDVLGMVLACFVALLALYVGYQVYRTVKRRGVLEFSAAVQASPDMDNLEPLADGEVRQLSVTEYVALLNSGQSFFKGGFIRLWGDWKGRRLEDVHEIRKVNYYASEKLLRICFDHEAQLSLWNPQIITESPDYLKILKADRLRWEWKSGQHLYECYYDYSMEKNKIVIDTNTDWKGDGMDVLMGAPALMMLKC